MTAAAWLVALGHPLDDLQLEVEAETAQDAAEIAASRFDRDRRLLARGRSLAATVIDPGTGQTVCFTVRAHALPVYTAHLETPA